MKPAFSAWKLVGTVSYLAAIDALMLLLAGDWRWRAGWIFCGWFLPARARPPIALGEQRRPAAYFPFRALAENTFGVSAGAHSGRAAAARDRSTQSGARRAA
jgi:hypothetical protein